jgi:uncharacterized membrane protein
VNDQRMDSIIGNLLRTGVVTAAAVVASGGAWYLATAGESHPAYRQFRPDVRGLHSLATLPHPLALILAGLLILIATPVARVLFSLLAFWMERDRVYMGITALVLAILLYSLGTSWL